MINPLLGSLSAILTESFAFESILSSKHINNRDVNGFIDINIYARIKWIGINAPI